MGYIGNKPAQTTIPVDDSVTTAMVQDDAVTADKVANAINTSIAANTSKVTNATHTGDVTGATALTIATDAVDIAMLSATGTADATTFLRGDNAWAAAGSDNTPSWFVNLSGDFSCATGTYTKVEFDTEVWDTDSAYDSTTNYRFTVPVGEGGKYLVTGAVRWPTSTSKSYYISFYKNGVEVTLGARRYYSTGPAPVFTNTAILDLAASDYCEMYVVQGSGGTVSLDASNAYFSGFKLAGV